MAGLNKPDLALEWEELLECFEHGNEVAGPYIQHVEFFDRLRTCYNLGQGLPILFFSIN